MTVRNLKLQSQTAGVLMYADPSAITTTLRIGTAVANKTVKSVTAQNVKNEFVLLSSQNITEGANSATETLSLRVSFSGSSQNSAVTAGLWANLKADVDAAIADGALKGFIPQGAVYQIGS